jgi:hypothetical protein
MIRRYDVRAGGGRPFLAYDFFRFVSRPQDRRNDFDAAAEKYRECRSALEPALLRLLRSENTGEPVNQSASSDLIAAINRLLAFADRP